MVKSFKRILKGNPFHYGSGAHGGQFKPRDFDDDSGGGEDADQYDRYLSPAKTRDVEPEPQRRPTKVYTEDAHNLTHIFKQFENDGCILSATPDVMAIKWKNLLPNVHPHEFLRAFFGRDGLTNTNLSQLQLHINSKDKKISFGATGDNLTVHGKQVTDYQRNLDLKHGFATHSTLQLATAAQGGGTVKKVFKDCIKLYDKIGVSAVVVYANIDRGAYSWGKYGYKYAGAETQSNHQKSIMAALKTVTAKTELSPKAKEEKAAIEKVLKNKKPEAIWALVDMKTPELDKAFKGKISKDSDKSSFIKMLTKDTSWSGQLDLQKGSPSRNRIEQYIS